MDVQKALNELLAADPEELRQALEDLKKKQSLLETLIAAPVGKLKNGHKDCKTALLNLLRTRDENVLLDEVLEELAITKTQVAALLRNWPQVFQKYGDHIGLVSKNT